MVAKYECATGRRKTIKYEILVERGQEDERNKDKETKTHGRGEDKMEEA